MQSLFRRTPSARKEPRRMSMGQLSGASALHDAVAKGKLHLARFILDAVDGEGPVNSQDKHGKTPLLRAVRIENEQIRAKVMTLLIKHLADVNAQDNMGRTPLSYACEIFHNDVVSLLVKNNVDPNLEDNNGNTPLMYCAMVGNSQAIEIVTKSFRRLGLEVDKMNADGVTPLIMAAKRKHTLCASYLVQEGRASVDQKDLIHNKTAIDWAKDSGWTLNDMNSLKMKVRRTSRIDPFHQSSGVSSNDSSTEYINNLPKINQRAPDLLTVKHEVESRVRSHSAPKDTSPQSKDDVPDDTVSHYTDYDLDGKRASLPEFILSCSVRAKEETEGTNSEVASVVCTNGMFVKRNAKKHCKMRPFSGAASRPPRQSKSFDSAIGRNSSSLEDLCDKSDDEIQGKKQKYLLSADPKQLLAMIPLSRSSDALSRYSKIRRNRMKEDSSSDSSDGELVLDREVKSLKRWSKKDGRKNSKLDKSQFPPLI